MKGALFALTTIVATIAFYFLFLSPESSFTNTATLNANITNELVTGASNANVPPPIGHFKEVTTPTWASSTPKNNAVVHGFPTVVIVRFRAPIVSGSTITVDKDGQPVDTIPAVISSDSLSLFISFPQQAGPGQYTARYQACTDQEVCAGGSFGFTVLPQ